jgi:starvation-inducible outer membrane lipoprotein
MKSIASALFIVLAATALAAEKVAVADLLKDPAKYHDKEITIEGKVAKFEQRTSRKGNPYFLFDVNGKDGIHVYGRGKLEPKLENGKTVTVTGKFRKEKKLGDRVIKNEIEVDLKKKPITVK